MSADQPNTDGYSPEDEIPLPSHPVLSEEETVRQLHADFAKHYAAKDAEIVQLKIDIAEIRRQHQQEANEWKTDEELTARVAELEKALREIIYMLRTGATKEQLDIRLTQSISPPSSALTRLQELERKAEELKTVVAFVLPKYNELYRWYKQSNPNAQNPNLLVDFDLAKSAMEKQK